MNNIEKVTNYNGLFLLAVVWPLLAYSVLQFSVILLTLSTIVFTTLSKD